MTELLSWLVAGAALYVAGKTGFVDSALDALDLSDNLKRSVGWAMGVRGIPALVTGILFVLLSYVFAGLAYRYDILPTYRYIQPVAEAVVGTGADWLSFFAVLLTLTPTIIEIVSAGLIKQDIKSLQYATYFFIVFDIFTDYWEAAALVNIWANAGLFSSLGWLAGPAEVLMKIGWTFLASFGFEFLFVLLAVTAIVLFANSRK